MPTLTALTGMLFWWLFAVRRGTISITGAILAYWLTLIAAFMLTNLCLHIGAALQWVPIPPTTRILAVLPLILAEGVAFALITSLFHGVFLFRS